MTQDSEIPEKIFDYTLDLDKLFKHYKKSNHNVLQFTLYDFKTYKFLKINRKKKFEKDLDDKKTKNTKLCRVAGECHICLTMFKGKSVGRRLICGHDFHRKCVSEWLDVSNVCPVCKIKVFDY